MLQLGPIFRALLRNKVGAILIALQIAFTMAVIVNSIFIIVQRSSDMDRPSGVDEANSFYLSSNGFAPNFSNRDTIVRDLAAIRALPGVVNAIQINAIPVSGGGWSMGLKTEPGEDKDAIGVAVYMIDEQGLNTLDVELIAGEAFSASDIIWREPASPQWPDKIILTKAMVERLFPDAPYADAIGKTVYINDSEPLIISGIIDQLQAPWVNWDNVENVMLSPERLDNQRSTYFVRTHPGQRDRVMEQVESMLAENTERVINNVNTLEHVRERSYRSHSAMIKILTLVIIVLTVITALGIVGLASFNVNRRRKQIGIRRALGATKGHIIHYFMIENSLITTVGVVVGTGLTIALNMVLVNALQLPSLTWYYIPVGVAVLYVVGQMAVFGPAWRASNIAPATATRTV